MQTIDNNNNSSSETNYVTLSDIGNMDACSFQNGVNPVNNSQCTEAFQNGGSSNQGVSMPEDPLAQLYFLALSGIGLYILYRFMEKSK